MAKVKQKFPFGSNMLTRPVHRKQLFFLKDGHKGKKYSLNSLYILFPTFNLLKYTSLFFPDQTNKYQTRAEQRSIPSDREDFTAADLDDLPELHPPDIMPRGNVGTPTSVFLVLIRECRLPPQVIGKLGLKFPRTRTNKMYSKMHFDYGMEVRECPEPEPEAVTTAAGHELETQGERLVSSRIKDKSKAEGPEEGEGKGKKRRQRRRSSSSSDSGGESERKQSDSVS